MSVEVEEIAERALMLSPSAFVQIVRDLRLMELEVPVSDQLGVRQIAQVEISLAQEFVSEVVHGSASPAKVGMVLYRCQQCSAPW